MSEAAAGPREQEEALTASAGAHLRHLGLVEVAGPDAARFLEGQLSQAVSEMNRGETRWSFVLHPQGKVVGFVRVHRPSPDTFQLLVDGGVEEAVAARLQRFLLRVDARVESRVADVVSVRGPEPPPAPPNAVPALWPAWPGWDLIGSFEVPDGLVRCGPEAWEAARIRAGFPLNGAELDAKTIPAESGLVELAADLDKGCYVGQELVARIDSRGRVNRHLRRLVSRNGAPLPAGSDLLDADRCAVGSVTSAAASLIDDSVVALGYVRREIEPGECLTAKWDSGEAEVDVAA